MRSFFALMILTITLLVLWIRLEIQPFTREKYLSKKVLEHSTPFSVTINTVLLQSLEPANESSGTSSEGL